MTYAELTAARLALQQRAVDEPGFDPDPELERLHAENPISDLEEQWARYEAGLVAMGLLPTINDQAIEGMGEI